MAPQTRALFIRDQTLLRPLVDQAQILAEWSAKNARQKREWVAAFRTANDRQAALDRQKAEADRAELHADERQREIDDNIQNGQQNALAVYNSLFTRIDEAVRQLFALRALCGPTRQDWLELRRIENVQPHSRPTSTQAKAQRAAQVQQESVRVQGGIERLRALKEAPPVPSGHVHRVPDHWGRAGRREIVNQRQCEQDYTPETFNVRLLAPGEGTWVPWGGATPGMARGSVWLNFDHNDKIQDRVFRKDTFMSDSVWDDPTRWAGDIRKQPGDGDIHDQEARVPLELRCHYRLNDIGAEGIVRCREELHWGLIDNRRESYRLYTELAPYGDLADMITKQRDRDGEPFPEPFIWCIAEQLAIAGKAMADGLTQRHLFPHRPEWKEIVHRDMKPQNVFLEGPLEDKYPEYDTPVLGDFGLAFLTTANDGNNPRWYNSGAGTRGFKAPEQKRWIDAETQESIDEWRLDEKTNVFGYGLILHCLLTLNDGLPEPPWVGEPDSDTILQLPPGFEGFSGGILELVNQCLLARPDSRPTFAELLDSIGIGTDETGQFNLARGMRNGTASAQERRRSGISYQHEIYELGLARNEIGESGEEGDEEASEESPSS